MSVATTQGLVDFLGRSPLLTAPQRLDLVKNLQPRFAEPRALAAHLINSGWLTSFQVNQIFLNKGADLQLGPYVLLQRLGEGGAGQVFQARHTPTGRIVALKMIRKELLADAETVQRFSREIKLISGMVHANIVQASAGSAEGLPGVLVMEYIDGTDLGRLVEGSGPLPLAQACDYARQAALALQHIHEKGLVHRDVKPPNLFVTQMKERPPWGVVKLLDLGLARLTHPTDSKTLAAVTVTGTVMGTLDYLAPEQALDFREVDIRADVYALGCTLFFLLTGRPPFPEGTAAQKLLLHQLREPPVLESLRPDAPPALADLVGKMLAKRPEDRFQTPGEAAQRLADPQLLAVAGSSRARTALAWKRRLKLRGRAWLWLPGAAGCLGLAAFLLVAMFLAIRGKGPAPTALAAPPTRSGPAGSSTQSSQTVYVADLPERDVVTAPVMPLRKTQFYWFGVPRPLALNGKTTTKGLMIHPPGSGEGKIKYDLNQAYTSLRTGVGIIDSIAGSPTPLTFRIVGDGRVLWESKPVQKSGQQQQAAVSVAGVKTLELVIACPGPDHREENLTAHALWFEPHLLR